MILYYIAGHPSINPTYYLALLQIGLVRFFCLVQVILTPKLLRYGPVHRQHQGHQGRRSPTLYS